MRLPLEGDAPTCDTLGTGKTLVKYAGPTPPRNTGNHRYVFLVFEQKSGYLSREHIKNSFPDFASLQKHSRCSHDFREYVNDDNPGFLVAANMYKASNEWINFGFEKGWIFEYLFKSYSRQINKFRKCINFDWTNVRDFCCGATLTCWEWQICWWIKREKVDRTVEIFYCCQNDVFIFSLLIVLAVIENEV